MIEIFVGILERAKADIQANMVAMDINASGRTSASFRVERTVTGVRLVMGGNRTAPLPTLEVGVAPEDVPKGTRKFTDTLVEWSREKGIAFNDERERRRFAYLLGRRIRREGTLRHMKPEDVYSSVVLQVADEVKVQATVEMTKYIHNLFK